MSGYLDGKDSILSMSCFSNTPDVSVRNSNSSDSAPASGNDGDNSEFPFTSNLLEVSNLESVPLPASSVAILPSTSQLTALEASIGKSAPSQLMSTSSLPEGDLVDGEPTLSGASYGSHTPNQSTGEVSLARVPDVLDIQQNGRSNHTSTALVTTARKCQMKTTVETNKRFNFMVAGGAGQGTVLLVVQYVRSCQFLFLLD